ncbi:MAG: hypothetical protein LBL79_10900, partial [Prevotella sp.]|jgi:hypothetical protein|nr:hypothetical protein [Prevotella sp.]
VAKNVDLKVGDVKFRADEAWGTDWGAQTASDQDFPFGLGKSGGDNFKIEKAGKYFLALNDLTGHYIIIPMTDLPK